LNAELLAVSIDDLSQAAHAVEQLGLEFPILYDESGDVVKSYGVFNEPNGYAKPSTFIIDTEGVVRWEFIGSTNHRTSTRDIIKQLELLS
jgi:peroxiredoxin